MVRFQHGYDHDYNEVYLGDDPSIWEQAKEFDQKTWIIFHLPGPKHMLIGIPLGEEHLVAIYFRLFGLWWGNAARVVYWMNEPDRYGFAYGTLTTHVERGEECFWVERRADGGIWYCIKAFSKPQFWMARLAYPLARKFQRQFVRDSFAHVKASLHAQAPVY